MSLEIKFPAPSKAPSINELSGNSKGVWAKRRRLLEPWRDAVGWAWKMIPQAQRDLIIGVPCEVHITIPFAQERTRDPHNYTGTVVKALIDQLVQQGVWVDDNPEWVTAAEPTLVKGDEVIVRLTPRIQVAGS